MRAVAFEDARSDWDALLDRVVIDRMPVAITLSKAEGVVLIAQDEWDAIMATIGVIPSAASANPSR